MLVILNVVTGQAVTLPGHGFDWSPDGRWLAGRQIEGEADLDQALQMVKDAARRALQDGNVVELI